MGRAVNPDPDVFFYPDLAVFFKSANLASKTLPFGEFSVLYSS